LLGRHRRSALAHRLSAGQITTQHQRLRDRDE
jgi:hypothetical protein